MVQARSEHLCYEWELSLKHTASWESQEYQGDIESRGDMGDKQSLTCEQY
jgi:hypothetical protein